MHRNTLLRHIFSARQNPAQLAFAGIGLLLGLVLMLLSFQLYLQIKRVLKPEQANPEYLILSKKITLGNTLMMGRADFSAKEIESLRKQPFTKTLGAIVANQFEVEAFGEGNLPFYTELFFEGVADELLDVDTDDFRWKPGDSMIPIVVSQDMLNLVNFGYALSKGLPQINKSTVGLLKIKVRIRGAKGEAIFDGKVVGFSERIPSILVPESFMLWANQNIGRGEPENPARLVIRVDNPANPAVAAYFESKDYQINQERLNASRIGGVLQVVMSVIGVVGLCFVGLAMVVFVLTFRVMLAEAKEEMKLLLQLGYTSSMIGSYLMRFFFVFVGVTALLSLALLYCLVDRLTQYFIQQGLSIQPGVDGVVWLLGATAIFLIFVLNTVIFRQIVSKAT